MQTLDQRNSLLKDIAQSANRPTLDLVCQLLKCDMQQAREDNDGAGQIDFLRNQGKIAECKTLLDALQAK